MSLEQLIPICFAVSLGALVLAVGLDSTLDDILYLLKRPRLLLRAVLAVSVITPAVAVLLVTLLPLAPVVKAGIVLMAIAPVPPLVPGKELKVGGRKEYAYGLFVAFTVLAALIVPATVALIDAAYGVNVFVSPASIARTMATSVIAPLAVGMLVRRFAPRFAEAVGAWLSRLSMLLLVVAVIPMLMHAWPAIRQLTGDGALAVMGLVAIVAIAAGHWLGGPDPRDRAALAVSAATRHPGLALSIAAANVADKRASAVILMFMLVSLVLVGVYQAWLKRRRPGPAVEPAG